MKAIAITLVLFVIFTTTPKISGFARTTPPTFLHQLGKNLNQCEDDQHKGNFTCVKNDDDTYNVTYDCHSNKLRRVELVLQYPNFPKKMKYLTIQNCESLVLDLHCQILSKLPNEEVLEQIHLQNLHILNISNFVVKKERDNQTDFVVPTPFSFSKTITINLDEFDPWDVSVSDSIEENEYIEEREFYYLNDLVADSLKSVTIENVKHAHFEDAHIPLGLFRCSKRENEKLEMFKLIKIKAMHFGHFSHFSENNTALKEFIMDNVMVLPKNNDAAFMLNNTKGVVRIINSDLSKMTKFFRGSTSELTVVGNKMKEIGEEGFSFEAEEFTFSDNTVEWITSSSFTVDSSITQVTNNIVHQFSQKPSGWFRLDEADSAANTHHVKKIYNFSSNVIHFLHPEASTFPPLTTTSLYDTIVVSNNSINCTCRNFMWFSQMAENRYSFRHGYNFWMKKVNHNKCLNIPNCSLAQVLYSYYDLCESDYKCPESASAINSSTHFLREFEELLGNTLHVNKETAETNNKIFQILKSKADNHGSDSGALMTINTLCLVLLLLLSCGIIGYFALVKSGKFRNMDIRPRRFRSVESALNSRTSLNT